MKLFLDVECVNQNGPRQLTPEEIESLREEMERDGQRMAERLRQEQPKR